MEITIKNMEYTVLTSEHKTACWRWMGDHRNYRYDQVKSWPDSVTGGATFYFSNEDLYYDFIEVFVQNPLKGNLIFRPKFNYNSNIDWLYENVVITDKVHELIAELKYNLINVMGPEYENWHIWYPAESGFYGNSIWNRCISFKTEEYLIQYKLMYNVY